MPSTSTILDTLTKHEASILPEWVNFQLASTTLRRDLIDDNALHEQSRRFLDALRAGLKRDGGMDVNASAWEDARGVLEELSRTRAQLGFSPVETATFVFSLKQPLFERLRKDLGGDAAALGEAIWSGTTLLDAFGLYTVEVFQKGREDVIFRQQQEMLELSTPVVELW